MREAYVIENITVQPGEKVDGFLKLAGGKFEVPATVFHGKKEGKTILITAGIHAAEYVGIQAAIELSQTLQTEKVCGTIIIVKVLNRIAFENRKTGSMGHTDGKNLNRVFPGDKNGTEMDRLAAAVVDELFTRADYYIDLHSGDDFEQLTPYVYYAGCADDGVVSASRKMAEQVDVPYMVKSNVGTGGAYNYAASIGIPSVLIERGGMGTWEEEESHSSRRDVRNILCHLGIYAEAKDRRSYYPINVEDVIYQEAAETGLWYPNKKAGDIFIRGEILGEMRDYEGNILEVSEAVHGGVILYQTKSLQVPKDTPMIAYGRIVKKFDERKERIVHYWSKRSESFLEQRRDELNSYMARNWLDEILPRLPEGKKLNILDVGCGAGFFTILLTKEGHNVVGIDLTPDMIDASRILAREENVNCKFYEMDAENLEFEAETFDVVISRNLTWTLPDVEHAYSEWVRVLKKGGVLLNFDANYGADDMTDTSMLPSEHAHNMLGYDMMNECEMIKRQLPISSHQRPAWDMDFLGKMKLEEFSIDLGISKRVYRYKDKFYNPTPLFVLRAVKTS